MTTLRKNCAITGVHPTSFTPTSVQLKSEINGAFPCKRQKRHLEFSTLYYEREGRELESLGRGHTHYSRLVDFLR